MLIAYAEAFGVNAIAYAEAFGANAFDTDALGAQAVIREHRKKRQEKCHSGGVLSLVGARLV